MLSDFLINQYGLALIIIIFVLLIFSFILSGSETGFTGSSHAKLHQYSRKGNENAKRTLALIENRSRLVGSILIANNLVNILASALASVWLFKVFGDLGVFYATIIMTLLIVIFAEVLPKNIALSKPEHFAMSMSRPMSWLIKFLFPFVYLIEKLIFKITRLDTHNVNNGSKENEIELRGAIELHNNEEPETEEERKMLRSILELDDVTVESAMTHRIDVQMIDLDNDYQSNIKIILESHYTRFPLYKSDHDRIVGILHTRELLRASGWIENFAKDAKKESQPIDLQKISSKPWFIPNTTSLYDQLQGFRERHEHFALVVDEYGSFMGIITLEDILEEIVGNIHDEHDESSNGVWKQEDGSFVVNGAESLRELNRELDWQLPEEGVTTLAGLILKETRMIPVAKQVFNFYNMRFEILERKRNRLERIRVTPMISSNENDSPQNITSKKEPV